MTYSPPDFFLGRALSLLLLRLSLDDPLELELLEERDELELPDELLVEEERERLRDDELKHKHDQ